MIGRELAHFRITAKLGEGGMGAVYCAEDGKLGREVAVKVLPDAVAGNPERLARFEREARLLASLSHPQIAGIYEVGTAMMAAGDAPGTAGGETAPAAGRGKARAVHYLVMELAAGETLAERIARGPLPLGEALPIARQIAEALEAAHERGIVHRDLKPGNVMVDADGNVKVLDFGLARAFEPGEEASPGLSMSPTLTAQMTAAGMLLGTAAYMSPEQARGKTADRRSDIWAFGVVLWEMLTGERLFQGPTVSDVMAAVLTRTPDLDLLPAATPRSIRRLLARCLEPDIRRRLQAIGEARIAIDTAGQEPAEAVADAPTAPRGARAWLPWAVAGALALALAGLAARPSLAPAPPVAVHGLEQFVVPLPDGMSFGLLEFTDLDISADGRRIVVRASGPDGVVRLYVRDIDSPELRPLAGTENADNPILSPDGEWVAFFVSRELRKSAVRGGASMTVAEVTRNRGASWSSDGYIYYTPNTEGGIFRVRAGGGLPEQVTRVDEPAGERTHRWPFALPGGKAVLFTADSFTSTEYYDDARIEAVTVADGRRHVLVEGSAMARFQPPDRLLFTRAGTIFAVRLDPRTLAISGDPVPVIQGVAADPTSGANHFAVSTQGSLVMIPGELGMRALQPTWAAADGSTRPIPVPPGRHIQISLAPDERRAAIVSATGSEQAIWVVDLESSNLSRLTFSTAAAVPVWSPDGETIYFGAAEGNVAANVYRKPADGRREVELVWDNQHQILPSSVSPDGATLLAEIVIPGHATDIWVVPLEGGGAPRPYVEGPADEFQAAFSPDGRFVAYQSDESGLAEVYVRPYPEPSARWQVSSGAGLEPRWSADGRWLFYRDTLDGVYRVAVSTQDGFRASRPEEVFTGRREPISRSPFNTYSVSADGSRMLYLGMVDEVQARQRLVWLLHWSGELVGRAGG